MTIRLNPHLNFKDNAREAMTFYHSILGGEITFSTFGEFGLSEDPAEQDKIMHSMITTPDGMVLMGSDTPSHIDSGGGHSGYSVTINGDEEEGLGGFFEKLSGGGTVTTPFGEAPWGAIFGMCVDRFGIDWMINCQKMGA
ncbi:MAG: PhnB protein [Actinomycetota bacterium]|jgi:PhnB protein|nr:PhnB protein [Actinomycetota bacterium]